MRNSAAHSSPISGLRFTEYDVEPSVVPVLDKIGDVDDIANAMEFLIKDKYMTGQYVSPNGGIYMP